MTDLAALLTAMGAKIEGAGTATNMAGAPFTFESYLLCFLKMELRFKRDADFAAT